MPRSAGKLSKARFCPFCGVENIERDRVESLHDHFVEFICLVCGQGWRILESRRVQTAQRLLKEHREMRPPNNHDHGPDQFRAACKKQFRKIKHEVHGVARDEIGKRMKLWLNSPEASELREHLHVTVEAGAS